MPNIETHISRKTELILFQTYAGCEAVQNKEISCMRYFDEIKEIYYVD